MRYIERYCEEYSDELIEKLKESHIKYSEAGDGVIIRKKIICFDMFRDQDEYPNIRKLTKSQPYLPRIVYSDTDLEQASWLTMSATCQKVAILNEEEAYETTCRYTVKVKLGEREIVMQKAHHQEQIGIFKIQNDIKWGSNHNFYTIDTGFSEIFMDSRVKDLIEGNHLNGFNILPVQTKKNELCRNTFQLTASEILPNDAFAKGFGEREDACHICGRIQYVVDGTYQFHFLQDYLKDEADTYMTNRIFGEGIAWPLYIISNRFFRLLRGNKMTRNLEFSPLIVV